MNKNETKMVSLDCFLLVTASRDRWQTKRVDGLKSPRVVSAKNGTPATKKDEVAIALKIQLPDTLFKVPTFSASISIDKDSVTPAIVEMDVINQIKNIVQAETGMNITLTQAKEGDVN